MGSRYRCRVSPSGVPGCIPGLGTGGTGEEFTLAGGLALTGPTDPFLTEADNFIPLTSGLWLPRDLEGFIDLGDGQLQYVGDTSRIFMIVGGVSFNFDDGPDDLILTYGINSSPVLAIAAAQHAEATQVNHVGISDITTLDPGDIVELFAAPNGGGPFTLTAGQLSIAAAGP